MGIRKGLCCISRPNESYKINTSGKPNGVLDHETWPELI